VFRLEVLENVSGVAQGRRLNESLAGVAVPSFAAELDTPFLFLSARNFFGQLFWRGPLVFGDIPP
jgi:hypothetical protein